MRAAVALFLIPTLTVSSAFAQAATDCAAPAPIPADLAGWQAEGGAVAAGEAHSAPWVTIGEVHVITLRSGDGLRWRLPPERAPRAGSFGGVLALDVREAGTYRIALADGVWIDLVGPNGLVASTGHGHGPACSGIRKMVEFRLEPGAYAVQLSGAASNRTRMLVSPR